MYEFLEQERKKIYMDDNKKLRTQTVLYGEIEGSWHTHLHRGLTHEEIEKFELRVGQNLPVTYKEFLSFYNGCYLFDLLRVGGKELDSYKGLSIEEQVYSTIALAHLQEANRRKGTPENHFIFADSLVKNAYYVMNSNENILKIDYKTKKVVKIYNNLKTFFYKTIQEGKENISNGVYFKFE